MRKSTTCCGGEPGTSLHGKVDVIEHNMYTCMLMVRHKTFSRKTAVSLMTLGGIYCKDTDIANGHDEV